MTKPKTTKAPKPAAATADTKEKKAVTVTGISSAVEMPVKVSRRGGASIYPFDELEKGQSFGVIGKTANDLASAVSSRNRKNRVEKKDEDGNTVFKTNTITGADGKETTVPTSEPEMVYQKKFFAVNVDDPSKDPDGATVRVFREI